MEKNNFFYDHIDSLPQNFLDYVGAYLATYLDMAKIRDGRDTGLSEQGIKSGWCHKYDVIKINKTH